MSNYLNDKDFDQYRNQNGALEQEAIRKKAIEDQQRNVPPPQQGDVSREVFDTYSGARKP